MCETRRKRRYVEIRYVSLRVSPIYIVCFKKKKKMSSNNVRNVKISHVFFYILWCCLLGVSHTHTNHPHICERINVPHGDASFFFTFVNYNDQNPCKRHTNGKIDSRNKMGLILSCFFVESCRFESKTFGTCCNWNLFRYF